MNNQQPYYPVNQNQDSLNFQTFDYQDSTPATAGYAQNTGGYTQNTGYDNNYDNFSNNQVSWASVKRAFSAGGYDDEPPLLEGKSYCSIRTRN